MSKLYNQQVTQDNIAFVLTYPETWRHYSSLFEQQRLPFERGINPLYRWLALNF